MDTYFRSKIMTTILNNLKYTNSHEWVRLGEDGKITVGITDHAQDLLGDIVFIQLPDIGSVLSKNDPAGVIESVKVASDLYTPMSGKVILVNNDLIDNPSLVNSSPYDQGWFFVLEASYPNELSLLLSSDEYKREIACS